jgi:hypothetical protein
MVKPTVTSSGEGTDQQLGGNSSWEKKSNVHVGDKQEAVGKEQPPEYDGQG